MFIPFEFPELKSCTSLIIEGLFHKYCLIYFYHHLCNGNLKCEIVKLRYANRNWISNISFVYTYWNVKFKHENSSGGFSA